MIVSGGGGFLSRHVFPKTIIITVSFGPHGFSRVLDGFKGVWGVGGEGVVLIPERPHDLEANEKLFHICYLISTLASVVSGNRLPQKPSGGGQAWAQPTLLSFQEPRPALLVTLEAGLSTPCRSNRDKGPGAQRLRSR